MLDFCWAFSNLQATNQSKMFLHMPAKIKPYNAILPHNYNFSHEGSQHWRLKWGVGWGALRCWRILLTDMLKGLNPLLKEKGYGRDLSILKLIHCVLSVIKQVFACLCLSASITLNVHSWALVPSLKSWLVLLYVQCTTSIDEIVFWQCLCKFKMNSDISLTTI